jgi:hypothetical protein
VKHGFKKSQEADTTFLLSVSGFIRVDNIENEDTELIIYLIIGGIVDYRVK